MFASCASTHALPLSFPTPKYVIRCSSIVLNEYSISLSYSLSPFYVRGFDFFANVNFISRLPRRYCVFVGNNFSDSCFRIEGKPKRFVEMDLAQQRKKKKYHKIILKDFYPLEPYLPLCSHRVLQSQLKIH